MKVIISAILFHFIIIQINPLFGQRYALSSVWEGRKMTNGGRYSGSKPCPFAGNTGFAWLHKDIIRITDHKTFTTRFLLKLYVL